MKRITHVLKQYDSMLTPFKPSLLRLSYILVGLALGMLVVYILVPVKFKNNAEPVQLDSVYQDQWVKGVAAEYVLTGDADEVRDKLIAAGVTANEVRELREENAGTEAGQWLAEIEAIAQSSNSAAAEQEEAYPEPGFMSSIAPILVFLGLAILGVLAAAYLAVFPDPITLIRWRLQSSDEKSAVAIEREKRARAKELASQRTEFETPPLVQFMSTYMIGDNFYDDSFAIEKEDGTFLGECGSGIAETVGVGDPKKVTATEVWMFSQNDIATVTHILMSEHAYNDPALRDKLAPRGEPVLAAPGAMTTLESKTLRTQIRVVDIEYADGPMPNSAFERLTVEIAVWEKEGAGIGEPAMPTTPPQNVQQPPPQAMPTQQPPPQQQPYSTPPQQPYSPPPSPPAQQPQQQPPPPQRPMQPPPQQQPPPQRQQPMQPPSQQPGRMQPPPQMRPPQDDDEPQGRQQPPPSPFGDTNY